MFTKGKKWIVFDAFDTLFTFKIPVTETYAKEFLKYGINVPEISSKFKNSFKATAKAYPNYGRSAGISSFEWWHMVISKTHGVSGSNVNELSRSLYDYYSTSEAYTLFDDVKDVSKNLSLNYKLVVLSNSDERLSRILRGFKINNCFDLILDSYSINATKPEAFLKCLELTKCNANEMLYIGNDIDLDYKGALKYGIDALLIHRQENHLKTDKIPIIKNLRDLL